MNTTRKIFSPSFLKFLSAFG